MRHVYVVKCRDSLYVTMGDRGYAWTQNRQLARRFPRLRDAWEWIVRNTPSRAACNPARAVRLVVRGCGCPP